MLTISKPLSAGKAQTYHQKEFTAKEQNYWSQRGVIAGEWQGRLAGPPERKSLKFITPTHFIWVWVDPKTKKISNSMGGTYKLEGDSYVETPEFAFEGMETYVGKPQKFTAKVEGDKWTHSGVLSEGQKLEEIWRKVK